MPFADQTSITPPPFRSFNFCNWKMDQRGSPTGSIVHISDPIETSWYDMNSFCEQENGADSNAISNAVMPEVKPFWKFASSPASGFSMLNPPSRKWSSTSSDTPFSCGSSSSFETHVSESTPASSCPSLLEEKDSVDINGTVNVKSQEYSKLSQRRIELPYEYTNSLPSKGFRGALVDALNIWLRADDQSITIIKRIVNKLHVASLMFDDIEDGSDLRRGKPATHTVYGAAQTMNSASFSVIQAVNEARQLSRPDAVSIALEHLLELHIGQGHDLHWTRHGNCPSENEYLQMVKMKTGCLLRLILRLVPSDETQQQIHFHLEQLVNQIGILYQIRDDYQNLYSDEYASQKGFCEDLDEGKFSLPMVHHLHTMRGDCRVRELLQRRKELGYMPEQHKRLVLDELERTGSMEYTRNVLIELERDMKTEIEKVEKLTGSNNLTLRLLVSQLSISNRSP